MNQIVTESLRTALAVVCLSSIWLAPVWADDTEIFFGDLRGGGAAPNVLFIMDTSGSMGNKDGGDTSRIDRVKVAMRELVNNLNNVNVGLMRFSNPGGPVLYPVSYIDQGVPSETGEIIDTLAAVAAAEDDAQEIGADGTMSLYDTELNMAFKEIADSGDGNTAEVVTIYATVADHADDADERASNGNVISANRCYVDFGDIDVESCTAQVSTSRQHMGLRFSNIDIPAGAVVTEAKLEMTTGDGAYLLNLGRFGSYGLTDNGGNGKSLMVQIYGELADSGAYAQTSKNISNRINDSVERTSPVIWDMSDFSGNDKEVVSTDFSSVIQEIIDQPGWDNGPDSPSNNVSLVLKYFSGSGRRRFQTADRASWGGDAPRLRIKYYQGSSTSLVAAKTGIRFQNVRVPQGVTITSASLKFNAAQISSGNADFSIAIENSTNPAAFTETAGDISSRSKLASIGWNDVDTWSSAPSEQASADITSLVQNLVNQSNWCGGNPMAFIIEGSSGLRVASSYDGAISDAPKLEISYEQDSIIPGSSCIAKELRKTIVDSIDDGHAPSAGAPITSAADALVISSTHSAVLRFTDVQLLQSATITNAYLNVYASQDATGTSVLSVSAENAPDAAPFNGVDGITSRNFLAPITWTVDEDWTAGGSYRSIDISSLVRAVQQLPDWRQGNDMAFRISLTSGNNRNIYSFDRAQLDSAQLLINYVDDGSNGARLVREELLTAVDSLTASGYTPIQDTLYEAYQYWTGSDVVWGRYRGGHNASGQKINLAGNDGPFTYTRLSDKDAIVAGTYNVVRPSGCTEDNLGSDSCVASNTGGIYGEYLSGSPVYDSPIDDYCQFNNHVIMLTDGIANEPHSESLIKGITGIDACGSDVSNAEMCVKELVSLMQNGDISPLQQTQRVTTHTIGFNFSSEWLADVAAAGGGQYREANNASDLVREIKVILQSALKTDTSFVAPIAAINQFNRLNHLNEIYFAVFRPDDAPSWPGNLKKYRLGNYNGDANTTLDADGAPAVNDATGFFYADSRSYWSTAVDGAKVDKGGAGSVMPGYLDGQRKVYTYLSSQAGQSKVLSDSSNAVKTGNTLLSSTILGITDAQRNEHIDWIRGRDVEDEDGDGSRDDTRYIVGDPLHSKPVAITYGSSDPNNPDITVYMGTNAGFLHAIDASTGEEEFGFIPEELLSNQLLLRQNSTSQEHPYGMDGSVTPWIQDNGNDGISPADPKDFVYIYAGMRRGGRSYYALDVTDRDNPEVLWTIKGGSGDFAEMGQTWGRPIPGTIKLANQSPIDVLYLSGGYDDSQDSRTARGTDTMGRALYIVNAKTGALIWSGGPSSTGFTKQFTEMQYSMPATLTVADVDKDGLDDVIFIGDTGGQVWRFDIAIDQVASNLVSGGVIADLGVAGGTNTEARNRRFYHAPDVSLTKNGGTLELAVTIGSGFRPSPLNKNTQDRFYMLRQAAVFGPPGTYTKVTESDLFDTTDNKIGDGTVAEQATAKAALASKQGWFFNLPNTGEKALSTPITFRDKVTFTTYEPNSDTTSCVPKAGTSRVYQVSLGDAKPVYNWDTLDNNLTEVDRSLELKSSSIIDEPVVICTGDGCDLFVGAEKPPLDTFTSDRIVKTFWRKDD